MAEIKVIEVDDKWNYVNEDNELLSPSQWFDLCLEFENGYGLVELDDKWNYLKPNGELLSPDRWFDKCHNFRNNYGAVQIGEKWNYINKDNELLSPNQWFDYCCNFSKRCDYARVVLDGMYYYINTSGQLFSKTEIEAQKH